MSINYVGTIDCSSCDYSFKKVPQSPMILLCVSISRWGQEVVFSIFVKGFLPELSCCGHLLSSFQDAGGRFSPVAIIVFRFLAYLSYCQN